MSLFRSGGALVIAAMLLASQLFAQATATVTAEDRRVFDAVLEHTVRPFVVSFSNRMDAPPHALLVLDVTASWCSPQRGALADCLDREQVEAAAQPHASLELMTSFKNRNGVRASLPDSLPPDLVSIPHDAVPEALRAWHERAYGYLAFSLPGYSGDRALVWVSYVCDNCGRGWLFTLHKVRETWVVDEVQRTLLKP